MNQPVPPTGRVGYRLVVPFAIGLLALAGIVMLGAGALLDAPATLTNPTPSAVPAAAVAPAATRDPTPAAAPIATPIATPTPASTATPTPAPESTSALDPPPRPGPFAMNLYQKGEFVSEAQKIWCVPAAMQTMVNIMAQGADVSVATQKRYYALARKFSPPTLKGDGAEPEGWAEALNRLGYGPYTVSVRPTRRAAIQQAAKALRLTGRPVGILVWYGAHSWVMSGFMATADPALTDRFTVTHVYIEDVWYPKISTIWGRSRPPGALVPVERLPRDFLPWRMPGGPYPDKIWKYVIVAPLAETPAG